MYLQQTKFLKFRVFIPYIETLGHAYYQIGYILVTFSNSFLTVTYAGHWQDAAAAAPPPDAYL